MRSLRNYSGGVRVLLPIHLLHGGYEPYRGGWQRRGYTPWACCQTTRVWQAMKQELYVLFFLSKYISSSNRLANIVNLNFMPFMIPFSKATALLCALFAIHLAANAQRLSDPNTIGWYNTFGTVYIDKKHKTSLWLEYQWRRDNVITNWQQSLTRVGVQYHFKNGVSAVLGYGYIITFPYGDYPAGRYHIPEHRIWQQLMWNGNVGRVTLNHRLRLEQRFVGKINQAAPNYTLTDWVYLNRVRYQLRAAVPINHKKMVDNTWYAAAFDEVFIGFGKNVNQNVFDQNRIGVLAGYQYNKMLRGEIGAFNQTVQQAALVGGKQVYQYNTGIIVNAYITL
ncbi:hypothetical protein CAP35_07390 [Chitinophagaceae bacterium IBVUCB1]|nr:hypothetical protein CAP35_07390 [Chitinophagaceae bacterium IBVUCB1]